MCAKLFSVIGLLFTLLGASLLFFYGIPHKKIGNTTLFGPTLHDPDNSKNKEDMEQASSFFERAKFLNKTGFLLIIIGTILQLVGVVIS